MFYRSVLFALGALVLSPLPLAAQGAFDNVISAQILPGWQEADGRRIGGLHLTLAPGWKTYWRSPGDGGIPPMFDWSGSENVSAVHVHWPRPDVQRINGMRSIGYMGEVVLPLEIVPGDAGAPMAVEAEIALGVCEDVCIPVTVEVAGWIDGPGGSDARITSALDARPRKGAANVTCEIAPIRDGMAVDLRIPMPSLGGAEAVVIEAATPGIWVSEPSVRRDGNTLHARAELVPPEAKPFAVDRSSLRFTVISEYDAVEIMGCVGG